MRTEKFCASTCFWARSMARRDHPVLDRDAFLHAEFLHQAGDAIGSEDPHQVVFERQVEARRSRVALTSGAASQLIVDAARLVTFGREDVQAAQADDLIVIGGRLGLEVREDPLPVRPRHAIEAVDVEEVDELVVVHILLIAFGQPLGHFLGQ